MATKSKGSPATKPPELSKRQAFTPLRVARSQIQGAPYNPRKLTEYARLMLRDKLQEVGLLTGLVWNRRTGNLVGGHQRLAILDALEGKGDYLLDVAAVELSPSEEREENIFLNNAAVQGTWDVLALHELLRGNDLDLYAMGFHPDDLEPLLGNTEGLERYWQQIEPELPAPASPEPAPMPAVEPASEAPGPPTTRSPAVEAAEPQPAPEAPGVQPAPDSHGDEAGAPAAAYSPPAQPAKPAQDDLGLELVVVFPSRAERDAFMVTLGLGADDRYADGVRLLGVLGLPEQP